jgi:thiol-disulfide isomerase/thioredoxin
MAMERTHGAPGISLPSLLIVAAVSLCGPAACDAAPDPTVITATVLDEDGRPAGGAAGDLRRWNDSISASATAGPDGRIRLELQGAGPGLARFAPTPDASYGEWVVAPVLLDPGEVELTVRLGAGSGAVAYPAAGPRSARWGRALALQRDIDRRYTEAHMRWTEAGQEGELDPGLGPIADSARALLAGEADGEVRAALWATLMTAAARGTPVSADTADLFLQEVEPGATVWATMAMDVPHVVEFAASRAEGADAEADADASGSGPGGPGGGQGDRDPADVAGRRALATRRALAYLDRVIEARDDPVVRPRLLLGAMQVAIGSGLQDEADAYLERLTREYPGSRIATTAKALSRRLEVGDPIPDVPLPALDSAAPPIPASALAGPATLVDFWAVWCTPCLAEIPFIRAAYDRFADRGFRVVSVSFDDTRETVRAFRRDQHPMPWTHSFVGVEQFSGGAVAQAYGITGLPTALLVGPDGRVLADESRLRGKRLQATLAEILGDGEVPK